MPQPLHHHDCPQLGAFVPEDCETNSRIDLSCRLAQRRSHPVSKGHPLAAQATESFLNFSVHVRDRWKGSFAEIDYALVTEVDIGGIPVCHVGTFAFL